MALATNALTTVATVEDELGIASSTETARLERMINIASAAAESYCDRVFYRDTAIAEKVEGTDGPLMFLSRGPVHSITSVVYLTTTLDTTEYEIRDSGGHEQTIYNLNGSWRRGSIRRNDTSQTQVAGFERYGYTVTYDAGWYTPKQDDDDVTVTRDLPYDIEGAVIAMVSFLRRSMGRDPTLKAEAMFESSQQYAVPSGGAGTGNWLVSQVPQAASHLASYVQIAML